MKQYIYTIIEAYHESAVGMRIQTVSVLADSSAAAEKEWINGWYNPGHYHQYLIEAFVEKESTFTLCTWRPVEPMGFAGYREFRTSLLEKKDTFLTEHPRFRLVKLPDFAYGEAAS